MNAFLYNKTFKKFEPEQEVKDADDWTVLVEEGTEGSEAAEKTGPQEKDETAEEGSAGEIEETKEMSEE